MAKVQGAKKLRAKLKRLGKAAEKEIGVAAQKSADVLVEEMKRSAPVKSGALRNSIKAKPGYQRDRSGKLVATPNPTAVAVVAGDKEAYYALMVEFGTSEHTAGGQFAGATIPAIPARPFFYPVWRANRRRLFGRVRRSLNKSLKNA